MKASRLLASLILAGFWTHPIVAQSVQTQPGKPESPKRRGFAVDRPGRPDHFPHRIWAFSGFEARPYNFGWFGGPETQNIPRYPGNRNARRGTGPWRKFAALKTGMNPVPGPRMGKINKLYLRYYLKGTDTVLFQYFSLSSNDNCHIRVSGLKQGVWAETVLNFTEDSRRNDGSPGAFKKGERMDDLQIYVGKPGDGGKYEIIVDDLIFFADDPNLPPEPEPFPRRVIFLAAFDTGVAPKVRAKYWPGQFEPVSGSEAPRASYWVVAKAVPGADGSRSHVFLEIKPPRHVGPNTKLRFRYWLKGTDIIQIVLHDATAKKDRVVSATGCKQGKWTTKYVTFSDNERLTDGSKMAVGNKIDSLAFVVPLTPGVELYVDEVVLFDAAKLLRSPIESENTR